MKRTVLLIILLSVIALAAAAEESEPLKLQLPASDSAISVNRALRAGFLSAVIPGAGQLVDKRYFRSGMFLAFEAISAAVSYNLYKQQNRERELALRYRLYSVFDTMPGRALLNGQADLVEYSSKVHRYRMYNALTWLGGGYVFNVLDAIGGRVRVDDEPRDPKIAGILAMVPGLGLGQVYNGEFSKAGMAIMGQVSLGVVALNYHRLMINAENQYRRLNNLKNNADGNSLLFDTYGKEWEFKRRTAFNSRNMYLWYTLFYYAFWIGDAVIDAHLHDYGKKMNIVPDLQLEQGGALLKLNVNF